MKILLFILLLIPTSAFSENWVHGGMWSKHPVKGLNEKHNLIGFEIDGYFLHKFENSYNDTSFFLGKINRDVFCLDKLCVGYNYGILTGYDSKDPLPAAFIVTSYEINGFGVDINYFPDIVTTIQFRYKVEF